VSIGRRTRGAAILFSTLVAGPVLAEEPKGGGVVGWVENTQGLPISGAVISVFGKGLSRGGLVTLSDSAGRFILPSLPAGSYTLRALGTGHQPSSARQVTVLPDQDALATLSLVPLGEAAAPPATTADDASASLSTREVHWLLRHKRRSVLDAEAQGPIPPDHDAEALPQPGSDKTALVVPDLAGSVEVLTNPTNLDGATTDASSASSGLVRLHGRFADTGEWTLGGLVTESESRTWRMAAEFVVEPASGHELKAGAGYGTRSLIPFGASDSEASLDRRTAGAIFVRDRWRLSPSLAATLETRYAYIGFLDDGNHVDPAVALEYQVAPLTHVRGSVRLGTVTPGGDLLTLSSLANGPAISLAHLDPGLRAERTHRAELAVDRVIGATTLGAQMFYEGVDDQLLNAYESRSAVASLRILNGGAVQARGMGVSVGHRFGDVVSGSLAYTFGHSSRDFVVLDPMTTAAVLAYHETGFHDVVARVDTFIEGTDTRLSAYYRINALQPETDMKGANHCLTNTRFDIQLNQGLPFLQGLTRAEWGVLVAVRNLFYESSEGATLDEIAVVRPPKRVLGGISVRF
jgi:hypothetical protein